MLEKGYALIFDGEALCCRLFELGQLVDRNDLCVKFKGCSSQKHTHTKQNLFQSLFPQTKLHIKKSEVI